jgi:hypothetical protein
MSSNMSNKNNYSNNQEGPRRVDPSTIPHPRIPLCPEFRVCAACEEEYTVPHFKLYLSQQEIDDIRADEFDPELVPAPGLILVNRCVFCRVALIPIDPSGEYRDARYLDVPMGQEMRLRPAQYPPPAPLNYTMPRATNPDLMGFRPVAREPAIRRWCYAESYPAIPSIEQGPVWETPCVDCGIWLWVWTSENVMKYRMFQCPKCSFYLG